MITENSALKNVLITEIPIRESKRVSTDCFCTVLGAIFALTLFILAIVFFSQSAVDTAYFNFTDPTTGLATSNDYYGFKTAFWCTIITAFGLGFLWISFVHCFPRIAPHLAFVLGFLSLIALGVIVLVTSSNFYNNNNGWKLAVAIFCFVLAVLLFVMFWFYSNEVRLQGIFLDYAVRFLHECTGTFLYIPIFLLFLVGFLALIVFQHLAFSSKKTSNSNYWDLTNPGFLGVLNIIEFIWGFQFLRDAFNFCVSGCAVDWYWQNFPAGDNKLHWYTPFVRLFTRHWGSVVGGSFLNAFLEVPTLIVELFTCHSTTCCAKVGTICEQKCFCFGYIFDLIRTDSYGYINLSGLPFCNAGRDCARNCKEGNQFVGIYNPLKHYRFAASVFLTALGFLFANLFTNIRVVNFTWWHEVVLVVIVYSVVCWFINIDADAAEGISTSFLTELYQAKNYQNMNLALPAFKNEIQERSNRQDVLRDGHC